MWSGFLLLCATLDGESFCEVYNSGLFAKTEFECYQSLAVTTVLAENIGWTLEGYSCHSWINTKEGEEM